MMVGRHILAVFHICSEVSFSLKVFPPLRLLVTFLEGSIGVLVPAGKGDTRLDYTEQLSIALMCLNGPEG